MCRINRTLRANQIDALLGPSGMADVARNLFGKTARPGTKGSCVVRLDRRTVLPPGYCANDRFVIASFMSTTSMNAAPEKTTHAVPHYLNLLVGIITGAGCGTFGHSLVGVSLQYGVLFGAAFAGVFFVAFGKRAHSPGAGLIWGLAFAAMLWLIIPTGIASLIQGAPDYGGMLKHAQEHFPQLVAYLLLLGMPVGLAAGIFGAIQNRAKAVKFSWPRAIVVGGIAGTLAGLVFSRWMYEGEFYPLLS